MYGYCRQWEDAVGDNRVLIVYVFSRPVFTKYLYVFSTDLYLLSIFLLNL